MKYCAAVLGIAMAAILATPARAAERGSKTRKTVVINSAAEDGKVVELTESGEGSLVTITKDGKTRVIKLNKGGELVDLGEKLDPATRLKLIDAKIAVLKTTGQLKTDIAVKRLEAERFELSRRPDEEIVAKKKEVNALKVRLDDARLDYEQAVKKLVPDSMSDLYLAGAGDADLMELNLDLLPGAGKRIIKRIEVQSDDDEEESD